MEHSVCNSRYTYKNHSFRSIDRSIDRDRDDGDGDDDDGDDDDDDDDDDI